MEKATEYSIDRQNRALFVIQLHILRSNMCELFAELFPYSLWRLVTLPPTIKSLSISKRIVNTLDSGSYTGSHCEYGCSTIKKEQKRVNPKDKLIRKS